MNQNRAPVASNSLHINAAFYLHTAEATRFHQIEIIKYLCAPFAHACFHFRVPILAAVGQSLPDFWEQNFCREKTVWINVVLLED